MAAQNCDYGVFKKKKKPINMWEIGDQFTMKFQKQDD